MTLVTLRHVGACSYQANCRNSADAGVVCSMGIWPFLLVYIEGYTVVKRSCVVVVA